MRKILEERLENARNDYGNTTRKPQLELKGQIEAYQDCLNLIQPRTEQEILKDFELLGWEAEKQLQVKEYYYSDKLTDFLYLTKEFEEKEFAITFIKHCWITINLTDKTYSAHTHFSLVEAPYNLTMQEHKLLNELFECYGWL